MMRWNGFGGSLVFAAVAAAALLVVQPVLAGLVGWNAALCLYAVAVVVAYLAGLGPSWRRGCAGALVATGLGAVLLALPFGVRATVALAAAVLAFCRSGILYRQRRLRAVVTETALTAAGLALADFLAAGSLVSLALAAWGYLMVQSAFFLIGAVRARGGHRQADPFDRARAELLALMEL